MAGPREHLGIGAALAAVLALAGCSRPASTESAHAPAPPPAVEPPAPPAAAAAPTSSPVEGATVGGDGSAIRLSALSSADLEQAALNGELGCGFSTDAASPLLVAMGDVASRAPAQGLVKVGDDVERVGAPGGFDAMLKGGVFSGAGKTIRIALTGPASGGGESPPRPATLTYDRADGARLTLAGRWECGP